MKNKIHYLFLCLCLVCTASFMTSCSDDDDSGNNNEVGELVGRWVSTTLEEWGQELGSNIRDDYQKETYTTTVTLNDDGTGSLVEEDGDRIDFEWQYDSETGILIYEDDEGSGTALLTWQNGSKFTCLMTEYEYDGYCWYTQYIFTRK